MVKQRSFQPWKRYLSKLSKTVACIYSINAEDAARSQNRAKIIEIKIKRTVKIKQAKTRTRNGVNKIRSSQKQDWEPEEVWQLARLSCLVEEDEVVFDKSAYWTNPQAQSDHKPSIVSHRQPIPS